MKKDEDPKKLTVYYIDANGKAQEMAGAYYDAASKSLIFKTNHLSVFAVVYDQSKLSFSDVSSANWFYDAVKFVVANNLFQGTTSTAFEPNAKMNRAMLATVLYR
ncbi:MAG: S-layer homology domain-containing protein, partial [Clostridiales bacterium]